MAEAADFSMPDAFAKYYLDRIIKKTEFKKNNYMHFIYRKKNKIWLHE